MSGFKDSISKEIWEPSGSPAIYKLIENLISDKHQASIIMTAKEEGFDYKDMWKEEKDKELKVKGLDTSIIVLTGVKKIPRIFGRFRGHLSTIRQVLNIWKIQKKLKPDIIYLDRSNILAGAIISRLTKIPVVLRVLGVTPSMKKMLTGYAISHRIDRWCYKSPFSIVIGTEDGSGTGQFLNKILDKNTRREVKLNGINKYIKNQKNNTNDKLNIALVGRIDPYKQTTKIIETIISMEKEYREKVLIHVVGDGKKLEKLKLIAQENKTEDSFIFYGSISHNKVKDILFNCDLYISFNIMGNLSNSNLEALYAGLPFILPEADYENNRDVKTFDIIPEEICIKLPMKNFELSLKNKLQELIQNPMILSKLQAYPKNYISRLNSWEERINWEKNILREIVEK